MKKTFRNCFICSSLIPGFKNRSIVSLSFNVLYLLLFSLQDLQNRGKTKIGIVFNLDKHDEPGSHWVAMFVDLENNFIFYFDSALNPVPRQISKLKSEIKKQGKHLHDPIDFNYIQNDYNHQKTNTECGMYCLFFIVTLCCCWVVVIV